MMVVERRWVKRRNAVARKGEKGSKWGWWVGEKRLVIWGMRRGRKGMVGDSGRGVGVKRDGGIKMIMLVW